MYCTKCGIQLDDVARFCSQCGTATANNGAVPPVEQLASSSAYYTPYRPLLRARYGKWIGGVCAGLARYWGVDPALVRIGFLALALCPVLPAFIPYIVCWIIIPQEPLELPAATATPPIPQRV